jgi:hypothetical protein
MKLANAAKHFDRTVATDAYGSATFQCQFNLFDDSTRDGLTVERRIISTAPTVTVPSRRVATVNGKQWILGDGAEDYFNNETIRIKYIGHQATGLAEIKTVQQALLGTSGATTFAALAWTKAARQIEINSDLFNVQTLYLSRGESLSEGNLIFLSGKVLWTRQPYEARSGLKACVVDELESPIETVTITNSTYNPLTDSYTGSAVVTPLLRMRWQEHFEYFSKAQEKYERGDCTAWTLKSAVTMKPSDTIALSDGQWRVLSAVDEGAVQSLHLRRA